MDGIFDGEIAAVFAGLMREADVSVGDVGLRDGNARDLGGIAGKVGRGGNPGNLVESVGFNSLLESIVVGA